MQPHLADIPALGQVWGEFNMTVFHELKPDLLVTGMFGNGGLWYVPADNRAEVEANVPTVGIQLQGRGVQECTYRFQALAEAIGATLPAEVDSQRISMLAAEVEFSKAAAAAHKLGVRIMAYAGYPSTVYIGSPTEDPTLRMFEELGAPLIHHKSSSMIADHLSDCEGTFCPYWESVPWSEFGKYPADAVLFDTRTQSMAVDEMAMDGNFTESAAYRAGQVFPWHVEPVCTYRRARDLLLELARHLRLCQKVHAEDPPCHVEYQLEPGGVRCSSPWTYTDDRGVTASGPRYPQRIVAQITAAATLAEFGMQDRIVGVFGPQYVTASFVYETHVGQLDLNKVVNLGEEWDHFDIQAFRDMKPDLLVSITYCGGPATAVTCSEQDALWWLPANVTAEAGYIVPTLAVRVNGLRTGVQEIVPKFSLMAQALSGNEPSSKEETERTAMLKAAEQFSEGAAAAHGKGIRILAFAAVGENVYIGNPTLDPVLSMFNELGAPLIYHAGVDFWETVTWDGLDKYPADVLLYVPASSRGSSVEQMEENGGDHWTQHPAVKAMQYSPWHAENVYTYRRARDFLVEFGAILRAASKVMDCVPCLEHGARNAHGTADPGDVVCHDKTMVCQESDASNSSDTREFDANRAMSSFQVSAVAGTTLLASGFIGHSLW